MALAKINMPVNEMKGKLEKRRMESLQTKLNGMALRTIAQSYVKRQWLWYAETVKSGDKILMLKVISGTLPTRINTSRGRIDAREKMCRNCKSSAETDLHVLSEFHQTKDVRICRHNSVVKKIAKELKLQYTTSSIQMERTWAVGTRNLKPDITMINAEGKATFVEITIPYEKDGETLKHREKEKEDKYVCLTLANLGDNRIMSSEVVGLAFGAAGTINKRTVDKLRKWKIATKARNIQMICMSYAARIWRMHTA